MKGNYYVHGITDLHDLLNVFQEHFNKPLMYETKGDRIKFSFQDDPKLLKKLKKFKNDLELNTIEINDVVIAKRPVANRVESWPKGSEFRVWWIEGRFCGLALLSGPTVIDGLPLEYFDLKE